LQNGQGIAVLNAAEHKPPINAIPVACGARSILAALVGTVSTCLTGPVNALISSSGERHRHYTAGIAVGLFALAFGLFAPVFTRLTLATPPAFIGALAGLAILPLKLRPPLSATAQAGFQHDVPACIATPG
jgi:benzoate membrane transport protein